MGMRFLVPIAMDQLKEDPFAHGDLYPGDLLWHVLRVPPEIWQGSAEMRGLRLELRTVAKRFLEKADEMDDEWKETIKDLLLAAKAALTSD